MKFVLALLTLFVFSNFSLHAQKDSLKFQVDTSQKLEPVAFRAPSPKSTWVGGVLAYNFLDGGGTENVIGAAKAELGLVKQFPRTSKFNLLVIGNLAKITSSTSEDKSKDVAELVQSSQGVSVAISPVYTFNPSNANQNYFRAYGSLGAKFNGFTDVGAEKETITLGQFRVTAGLEFEGLPTDKGAPFNLSTELIFSAFDKSKYNLVFGEEKSNILALETMLIIPVGNNFGFLGGITVSTNLDKPVIQAGLIVRK